MRSSRPMPRATSTTSAPVSSQTLAISLMNEIFVARKAFEASLTISALAMSVRTSGACSGAYSSTTASPAQSPSSPTTTRSGCRKSLHRRALLEELGAGHVAQTVLALLAEDALDRRAGAARHRRLHHQRMPVGGGNRIDDGVHRRQVGVAGVGRRRADGDEQQPRVLERLGEVGREVQSLAIAREQLLEARLVDRHLAAAQPLDLRGVDVDAPHLAAELGKAGGGDQTDVAGADHPDRLRALCSSGGEG